VNFQLFLPKGVRGGRKYMERVTMSECVGREDVRMEKKRKKKSPQNALKSPRKEGGI